MELARESSGKTGLGWIALAIAVVLSGILTTGPTMRERDQAALLSGSLELARSGEVLGAAYYNYDRQFLTYWLVAGALRVSGLSTPGAELDSVVLLGNVLAAGPLVLALAWLLSLNRRRPRAALWLTISSLLAPVILLSIPLLASNLFSATALVILVGVMKRLQGSPGRELLCGLLVFCAVGFRQDAVLVLPLLCLLGCPTRHFAGLLRARVNWIMGGCAVLALSVGMLLGVGPSYDPGMFFDLRIYSAYLSLGLLGGLMALVAAAIMIGASRCGSVSYRIVLVVALLAPLGYYSFYLFTPRHLILTALVPLFVISFRRGAALSVLAWRNRAWRALVISGALVTVVFSVVGIRFHAFPSFRPSLENQTLYPTADGYWPMGGSLSFLGKLKNASTEPIDHNQRAWQAWKALDPAELPEGSVRIHSAGLVSLGKLALSVDKEREVRGSGEGEVHLVLERSLGKTRAGFRRASSRDRLAIDWDHCWLEEIAAGDQESLYQVVDPPGGEMRSLDQRWVVRIALRTVLGEDDFILWKGGNWREILHRRHAGHRVAFLWRQATAPGDLSRLLASSGTGVQRQEVGDARGRGEIVSFVLTEPLREALLADDRFIPDWAGVVALPTFMAVDQF